MVVKVPVVDIDCVFADRRVASKGERWLKHHREEAIKLQKEEGASE